jgi:hypothetical protein
MTALDHVCDGRALLCLEPPFDDGTVEAIAICRAMWRNGVAHSTGPRYVVPGALNRPLPPTKHTPRIALDLTDAETRTGFRLDRATALVDLFLFRTSDFVEGECRLQRVRQT